jgi:type VI secretion system protein VasD
LLIEFRRNSVPSNDNAGMIRWTLAGARRRASSTVAAALVLVSCGLVSGCASNGGGPVDKALELIGLKKPQLPENLPRELPVLPRKVALRLHAGELLNTDEQGRSLSIVARVYKLRASSTFTQLPYEAFSGAIQSDRSSPLAQDVVEMREITMTPGQRHEVIETVPVEATYVAVVALFRTPAPQRWRFVFETKSAANTGITLGLHGCAMSVAEGQPLDTAPELARLAGVRCRSSS